MDKFQVLTDIYFGDDSLARLAEIPYKKVFIIADPFVVQGDLIRHILKPLRRGGIEHQLFTDVMPDPPIEAVRYGVSCFNASGCECIIAIGGGSALDLAKAVRKVAAHMAPDKKIYLIAIPTPAVPAARSPRSPLLPIRRLRSRRPSFRTI